MKVQPISHIPQDHLPALRAPVDDRRDTALGKPGIKQKKNYESAGARLLQPRWDSFMRMLDPVASRLPWMVAAGNHEIEAGATNGTPFVAYEHRFRMPAAKPSVQANECGRGGGLEGDVEDTAEWQVGRGADDAQAAATEVSMRLEAEISAGTSTDESSEPAAPGRVERAVVEAALRVRRMYGSEGITGPDGGRVVGCCPSEWSGTYDFGNR